MNTTRVSSELSKSSTQSLTSSTSLTETINVYHEFKIRGYSVTKGLGIGKFVSSDNFSVAGESFAIYFYPNGKSPDDNSSHVSLFIALASESNNVRALFELTLVDQSGNGKHKVHSHFVRALENGPYTLKYRGSMWGYKKFYRRDSLESSDYVKDDCILVRCRVGVVRSITEVAKSYSMIPPVLGSNLGKQWGKLLVSGKGCDVVFKVGGESFAAHKLVLATRSRVFKAQLYGSLSDRNTRYITIQDMEPVIFKVLLHFIYRDELPNTQELVNTEAKSVSTHIAQHLLEAADRYALERLKAICESKLCEDIAINTVATTLVLAEQHHCFQLKSVCLKFIASPKNLKGVIQTDGFDYVRKTCPSLLTELLEYVARLRKHSVISSVHHRKETFPDGFDESGRRRVKPRLH